MFNVEAITAVYLAAGVTDMRKSIDALVALVTLQFKLDPFSSCLFVFCNRERNKLKVLHWDHAGFWLYYRRLERATFRWPSSGDEVTKLTVREFRWLLDGLEPKQKQAHKAVLERHVI